MTDFPKIRRPCKRCEEMFTPETKRCRICPNCDKRGKWNKPKYYFDDSDYLTEHQPENLKYKTVYKKGRGAPCHSQKQNSK